MTLASHAEGRQLDPGQVYFWCFPSPSGNAPGPDRGLRTQASMLDSPTACGGGGEALEGSFPLRAGKSDAG